MASDAISSPQLYLSPRGRPLPVPLLSHFLHTPWEVRMDLSGSQGACLALSLFFFAAGSDRWSITRSTPEEVWKQTLSALARLILRDQEKQSERERERERERESIGKL